MKKFLLNKYLGVMLTISGLMALPLVAFAQNSTVNGGLDNIHGLFPAAFGSIGYSTSLTGPNGLIYSVIFTLLTVAGGLAVLFLIIGGFWYITSAGNEEQAEKGKSTLINAIIGIIIIVLSYVIIDVIANFVAGGQ